MGNVRLHQTEVLQAMRTLISSGEWRIGQRLPPEQELVDRFHMSRPTIRLVLDQLIREGLIQPVQGNGRKIRGRIVVNGQAADGILSKSIVLLSSSAHATSDPKHELGGKSERAVDAAITASIQQLGWHCLNVAAINLSATEEEKLIAGRPAGFAATEAIPQTERGRELLARLLAGGFPVATAGSLPELARYDRVYSDHEAGASELARWLIGRGCQHVAVVGSKPLETYWVKERIKGCVAALAGTGLAPPRIIYIPGKEAGDESEHVTDKIHRFTSYLVKPVFGPDPVDAIMALTDWDANIVQQSLVMMGKRTNADIVVTGYDNLWTSVERRLGPGRPDASVDKLNIKIGEAMVRLLIERIENRLPTKPQCRIITPRLVVNKASRTRTIEKAGKNAT